jgi:hypothetical protein
MVYGTVKNQDVEMRKLLVKIERARLACLCFEEQMGSGRQWKMK